MRVVFMGTPEFAVPSLTSLHAEHDVVAVYTRPDAASGRGRTTIPSPVAQVADELGIPLIKPASMRTDDSIALLAEHAPEVIVVAAFGMILPRSVLEIPPLGCINVHASILPRWRGAAPIQRAILEGDPVTGVSIMLMEEGLDTGPYCATAQTEVDDKTTDMLTDELARVGASLLIASLERIKRGECEWMPQREELATHAPKISKSDVALSPDLSSEQFLRRVRAASASAPARAQVNGRSLSVGSATAQARVDVTPGCVTVAGRQVFFGVAGGAVRVLEVKPDGKASMDAAAWACGLHGDHIEWGAVG